MFRTTDEMLIKHGIPSNILTRTIYRVVLSKTLYTISYSAITIASIITRKDKLTILNSASIKLGLGPVDPTP